MICQSIFWKGKYQTIVWSSKSTLWWFLEIDDKNIHSGITVIWCWLKKNYYAEQIKHKIVPNVGFNLHNILENIKQYVIIENELHKG